MSNFQVVTESTLGTTTQVTPGHPGPVDLSQEHLMPLLVIERNR